MLEARSESLTAPKESHNPATVSSTRLGWSASPSHLRLLGELHPKGDLVAITRKGLEKVEF